MTDLDRAFVRTAVKMGHLEAGEGERLYRSATKSRPGLLGRSLVRSHKLSRDQVLDIYTRVGSIPCPRCSHPVPVGGTNQLLQCTGCKRKFRLPITRSFTCVGRTLGDYKITERIGQGGMGDLYKAIHPVLEREYAVKVISPECTRNKGYVGRFKREARVASKVDHPNIIGIVTVGKERDGLHYIVMPYINGENLTNRVERIGALSSSEALDVLMQIARGLEAIHHVGILHRDIKPSNVLVENKTGRVLLGDFGLAREEAGAHLTQTGVILGTPQYMSPEQCDGEDVDQRSDLYNLGVTLFYLLHGRPPFINSSPMTVMMRHKTDHLPVSRDVMKRTNRDLLYVMEKLTRKKPDRRYQSIRQLLVDLQKIKDGKPVASRRWRMRNEEPERRRGPWLMAAVAVFIGVLAGGLFVTETGPFEPTPALEPPKPRVLSPQEREQRSRDWLEATYGKRLEILPGKPDRVRIVVDEWDVASLDELFTWERKGCEVKATDRGLTLVAGKPDSELLLLLGMPLKSPVRLEASGTFVGHDDTLSLGFRMFSQRVRGADRWLFLGFGGVGYKGGMNLRITNTWPADATRHFGPSVGHEQTHPFDMVATADDAQCRIDHGQATVSVGITSSPGGGRFGLCASGFSRLELTRLVIEAQLDREWVARHAR